MPIATKKTIPTTRQLKALLHNVQAIAANAGGALSDAENHGLLGVEQALQFALGNESYVGRWLERDAALIADRHFNDCDCAACRFYRGGK